jgi:putative redox protein
MAVTIDMTYEGDLECTLVHGPSGDIMKTDAPVDNQGRGAHFSPTDLLGASLGSCILTTMGIKARDHGWDMKGATCVVSKDMGAVPRRHISKLTVEITMPKALDQKARTILERVGDACPVTASLGPMTKIEMTFRYV